MKNNTLEQVFTEAFKDVTGPFEVIAYELWGNKRDGFETNDSWFIRRDADLSELLEAARGRWEVFKVNYSPRATIKGIAFSGDDRTTYVESDGIPFLEIRIKA